MKLIFLLNQIKHDLNLIPVSDGDKVSLYDVSVVIDRWSQALQDENTLKESEQRFQELLIKEPFKKEDYKEAIQLLMMIHRPLISGRNNVMGVRLRDADFLRLGNRVMGLPVETGIAEYNQRIAAIEREEKECKRQEQEQARKKEIVEFEIID